VGEGNFAKESKLTLDSKFAKESNFIAERQFFCRIGNYWPMKAALPQRVSLPRRVGENSNIPHIMQKPVVGMDIESSHSLGESLWQGSTCCDPTLAIPLPPGQQNKVCRLVWEHMAPSTMINNAWVWVIGPNGNQIMQVGQWSSLTYFTYTHSQIGALMAGVAWKMSTAFWFQNVG
jgi:hypothetical protein